MKVLFLITRMCDGIPRFTSLKPTKCNNNNEIVFYNHCLSVLKLKMPKQMRHFRTASSQEHITMTMMSKERHTSIFSRQMEASLKNWGLFLKYFPVLGGAYSVM